MQTKLKRGAGKVLFLRQERIGYICNDLNGVSLINSCFPWGRNLHGALQSMVPDGTLTASRENLLEMQILGPHWRPPGSEILEVEPSSLCFTVPPGDSHVLLCNSHAV